MSYDRNGNWYYGAAADIERVCKPRIGQRIGYAIVWIWALTRLVLFLAVLAAVMVAIVGGSWYLIGRAVGAGMSDSRPGR